MSLRFLRLLGSIVLCAVSAGVLAQSLSEQLLYAIQQGDTILAEQLIAEGADCHYAVNDTTNIIVAALKYDRKKNPFDDDFPVTDFVIRHGYNFATAPNNALLYAVLEDDLDMVVYLALHGGKAKKKDRFLHLTPLAAAKERGLIKIEKALKHPEKYKYEHSCKRILLIAVVIPHLKPDEDYSSTIHSLRWAMDNLIDEEYRDERMKRKMRYLFYEQIEMLMWYDFERESQQLSLEEQLNQLNAIRAVGDTINMLYGELDEYDSSVNRLFDILYSRLLTENQHRGNLPSAYPLYKLAFYRDDSDFVVDSTYVYSLMEAGYYYENAADYENALHTWEEAIEILDNDSVLRMVCTNNPIPVHEYDQLLHQYGNILAYYKHDYTKAYEYQSGAFFYNWLVKGQLFSEDSWEFKIGMLHALLSDDWDKTYAEAMDLYKDCISMLEVFLSTCEGNYENCKWQQLYTKLHILWADQYARRLDDQSVLAILNDLRRRNLLHGWEEEANRLYIVGHTLALQYDSVQPLIPYYYQHKYKRYFSYLDCLSEEERSQWIENQNLDNLLSLCISVSAAMKFPTDSTTGYIYNDCLFHKGLLLRKSNNIVSAIENSGDDLLISRYHELIALKRKEERLLNQGEAFSGRMDSLKQRINDLDRLVSMHSSKYANRNDSILTDWKDIQRRLTPGEVAVEFVTYGMYFALVITPDCQSPKVFRLCMANSIDGIVPTTPASIDQIYNDDKYATLLWEPLLAEIPQGSHIYYSTDGLLHEVNMEALIRTNGRRVNQDYEMTRLSSTRELLTDRAGEKHHSAIVYGGIQYNVDASTLQEESALYANIAQSRGFDNDTIDRGTVRYLPETKTEAKNIRKMLSDNHIQVKMYTAEAANEESFKALSGQQQQIIHIGTHGFAWTDSIARGKDYFKQQGPDNAVYIDPLTRCGLLFAGANTALSGHSRFLPAGVQDGILTAKEISLMDLKGCDLLVLSACETARGDVKSEGVFGLQRAFKMARVQTLIMSLWKVNDAATRMLMTEFYRNWIEKKQTKHEAFKNAQNAVQAKYEEPEYWAGFIMLD